MIGRFPFLLKLMDPQILNQKLRGLGNLLCGSVHRLKIILEGPAAGKNIVTGPGRDAMLGSHIIALFLSLAK